MATSTNTFTTGAPGSLMNISPNVTTVTPVNNTIDPFTPCPRAVAELVVGLVFGALIVASNIACIKVVGHNYTSHHPESKGFIINLAVTNILCGIAVLGTNSLDFMRLSPAAQFNAETCLFVCRIWAPIYIYCVMLPFVALAILSVDIAYYCHRPMDYHRRMSPSRRRTGIIVGWFYPLIVIAFAIYGKSTILCDKNRWEINIHFIIFPIMLMLVPALCVVFTFVYIIRRYWVTSSHLAQRMRMPHIGAGSDTKTRLVRRFVRKFLHLIVFSIICGFLYTLLTIIEATVESRTHVRLCILIRLDRLCISLNSLISPWIYCLATRQNRKKSKRKLAAWWHNSGSQLDLSSRRKGRKTKRSAPVRNSEPSGSLHHHRDNASNDVFSDEDSMAPSPGTAQTFLSETKFT